MKVLFVYSLDDIQSVKTPLRSWTTIQFGISYISSVLKADGHQTQLVVLGSKHWKDSVTIVKNIMNEYDPDLVCFTAVYSQYSFIEKIARYIKGHWPGKYLFIGGVHATLQPDAVIAGPFDAVCLGEGEYPTLELCRQLEGTGAPHGILNVWFKLADGGIERNAQRDFIHDLDSLPFLDRDMWRPWISEQVGYELSMLLGRGCPYDCTYCSNHVLRKVAPGKYVRMRSPGNILKEVAALEKSHPHRHIYFEIETIALNKPWLIELCNQLIAFNSTLEHPMRFGCNFRISSQSLDESLFIAFEKASFYRINIGLESGSERIRREVLKRNYSNDDFLHAVSLARKHGMKINVYNMIGLPGESLSDHQETVRLNRRAQPDGHYTGIFYPYPGTELYDRCVQQGLIPKVLDTKAERMQPVIELPHFSKKQIRNAHKWFDYNVYRGYKPLWKILILVIMVKVRSNPPANFLFRKIIQFPGLRDLRAALTKK